MHISVLKNEITQELDYLKEIEGAVFVDGTFGLGGHSLAIAERLKGSFRIIGFDKDNGTLRKASEAIPASLKKNFVLVNTDFKEAKNELDRLGIKRIDGAFLDLGVSSIQIDSMERGFSFKNPEAPLDMRMNPEDKLDAAYILNTYPKERIEFILSQYGEEKFARRIATSIAFARKKKHFETVGDLLVILEESIPTKFRMTSKIHYATRTFQALRIEVNGELEGLDVAIKELTDLLRPGGKIAVISFHSLEDRIVKNVFKDLATGCICPKEFPICQCDHEKEVDILTRKPMLSSFEEITTNPRSRSAKLRVAKKL